MIDPRLRKILAIGHDTSMRGAGVSLREALQQAEYADARASFGVAELLLLIRENPDLIEQWVMYSEDKRTSGGWYLGKDTCEVGQLYMNNSQNFESLEEATAQFVIRELDYWSGWPAAQP